MNSELKKKLVLFAGVGVGLVVLILLVVWIVNLLGGNRMNFPMVEEKLKRAAVEYYKKNEKLLPTNGGEVVVDAMTLVDSKFMKPLEKIVPEGASCTGRVVVKQKENNYSYTPYLNCGDVYRTVELYKKVIEENTVTTGNGLYEMNGEYVFRGEYVNNYVKSGEDIWLITKITNNNQIQLIKKTCIDRDDWDDRYNNEKESNFGINNYSISRIKNKLEKIYSNDKYISPNLRLLMDKFNLCIGKRLKSENVNDGSIECSEVINDQLIGLLPANEYINASLDATCAKISDSQCQNYNYLVSGDDWWLATGTKKDTYQVYKISGGGNIVLINASSLSCIRPIIRLSSDVMFDKGNGTKENPYIINAE